MNSFEKRQWQVTEYPFRPGELLHRETIFTIGNGLVGVRGSFEEGYPQDSTLTLAAGIFNQQEGQLVPELVPMPNWLALKISINGSTFRLDEGRILGYRRSLDLKRALLERGVLWLSPNKDVLRLHFERFTSLANPNVLALRVLLQVLSEGTHEVTVESALDGDLPHPEGVDHWGTLAGSASGAIISIDGRTSPSDYHIAMRSHLHIAGKDAAFSADSSNSRRPAHSASFTLEHNEKVWITKLVALHTSRDSEDPAAAAAVTLGAVQQAGYEALQNAHLGAWSDYWDHFDIRIEGDELAQLALRFCTYHFLIATPRDDERVSIGAKTLSGHGYKGHVFWDTELFIVPPLTLAYPELSRRLLMYRYHNLQGARNKAAEGGYEGAMFPWESTDTGEETTPRWVPFEDGTRIRIWTGDNEQHISTDIAYAVLQYWRWTGDDLWFRQFGAELVLDTAKFWGSRAEYNAAEDRYELRQQIGPDEYHENVDNSVFTNRMVVWHLEQALELWDWLQNNAIDDAERLALLLDLNPERLATWREIAAKMWIPQQDGVLEQFENFFERLQPINLKDYTPRTTNMDVILGHEGIQTKRVIKQADVVMLMYLLHEELGSLDFLHKNWDLYSEVVDHGSSLSPSIHALVAARLGLIDRAYDDFIYSATIDLNDNKGNVRDGIHAAACGGIWQAVVLGFCGLELGPDGPQVTPRLPEHWRRVSFQVIYRGRPIRFTLTHEGVSRE